MVINKHLPDDYVPFTELVICGNTLLNGSIPFEVQGHIPLLVGKGEVPEIWLTALSGDAREWVQLVRKNKVVGENWLIELNKSARKGLVQIVLWNFNILRAKKHSETKAVIEQLDLRPLGLNIYGDANGLHLGNQHLIGNSFRNVRTMIAISVKEVFMPLKHETKSPMEYHAKKEKLGEIMNEVTTLREEGRKLGREGKDAEAKAKYAEAEAICDKLLGEALTPEDEAVILTKKGIFRTDQGKNDEALEILNEALKKNSKDPEIYFRIMLAYREKEEYERVVDYGERAMDCMGEEVKHGIEEALHYPSVCLEMGLAFWNLGRLDDAIEATRKAHKANPVDRNLRVAIVNNLVYFLGEQGGVDNLETARQMADDYLTGKKQSHLHTRGFVLLKLAQCKETAAAPRKEILNLVEQSINVLSAANELGTHPLVIEHLREAYELKEKLEKR